MRICLVSFQVSGRTTDLFITLRSGILLSFALLPYIVFGEFDHGRKFYQAIVALIVWLIMTLTLICLFYRPEPIYVKGASVFTCIPPLGDTESMFCLSYFRGLILILGFCKAHTHEPVRWGEFWETHNKSTCQAPWPWSLHSINILRLFSTFTSHFRCAFR